MYATCDRLVVLRVLSPEEAENVYDGPGHRGLIDLRGAGAYRCSGPLPTLPQFHS